MMQWKSHYFTTEKNLPTLLTFKDPILYKIWILWNIQNFLIRRNLLKSIKKRFSIYLPNIDARRKELRESPIPYKWLSKNFDLADCYESWFRSKIFVRVATKMSSKSSQGCSMRNAGIEMAIGKTHPRLESHEMFKSLNLP